MGYLPDEDTFLLIFEDRPGLEVRATSTSLGNILGMADLEKMTKTQLVKPFQIFIDCVTGWNLEHREGPERAVVSTPISVEGLFLHSPKLVMDMIVAWREGILGTPGPLEKKSGDGNSFPEGSIPTETWFESPMS